MRRSERKLIRGILCTNVSWSVHVDQQSSLVYLHTPIRSPSNSGRCLEVVGLQHYVQPHMRVSKESWLTLNFHLHGIRPPAMDDSNSPLNEEVEAMRETDDTTYCWAGQLATGCLQGSPITSSRNIAQASRKNRASICFLGRDDWVSGCRQRWPWWCDHRVERH